MLSDLAQVMSSVPGRRVFWRLLQELQPMEPALRLRPGCTMFESVVYNTAQRDAGVYIMKLLSKSCLSHYNTMVQEHVMERMTEETDA